MAIVLTLGADAAAGATSRVLKLTHASGAALLGGDKEHLGKVHHIKTKGPKKPDSPDMRELRKVKKPVPLNKIKKTKKESVQRVL
jgi:hypothetical protein